MRKLLQLLFGSFQPEPVKKPVDQRPMFRELYTQSIKNVNYIKGHITVTSGMINYAKGESMSETKQKRANMQIQLEWLKKKLAEELFMVEYYKLKSA